MFVQAACWEMSVIDQICQMALDFGEKSGSFNLPRGMDAKKDKTSTLNKLHNSAVNFQCWRWTFNSSQYNIIYTKQNVFFPYLSHKKSRYKRRFPGNQHVPWSMLMPYDALLEVAMRRKVCCHGFLSQKKTCKKKTKGQQCSKGMHRILHFKCISHVKFTYI